ncbi:hypothetical protein Kpol_1015p16 [Vanderwaltozyma polyspora DSM 70294]|uniref:Uncharacterized protein n=1 Tax=Vanderwaltozyma polyspora (strain ATCC 22028 / DSM 70294 / BCRC 21397 / CBS 2163 / NBRC 10782 / NRRL Y-8283 / UCD 57-17) TaxID=436907 RepID=A7TQP5_VANPO|nr:uncharacterized protein Kpol_1015p16 [Vanderwaltozyma polyspora DSM 70294]EDO15426.1 hypothetical protein Kpol_1015p16 [Vanderwaltozyma polyspora DSM 70294]
MIKYYHIRQSSSMTVILKQEINYEVRGNWLFLDPMNQLISIYINRIAISCFYVAIFPIFLFSSLSIRSTPPYPNTHKMQKTQTKQENKDNCCLLLAGAAAGAAGVAVAGAACAGAACACNCVIA